MENINIKDEYSNLFNSSKTNINSINQLIEFFKLFHSNSQDYFNSLLKKLTPYLPGENPEQPPTILLKNISLSYTVFNALVEASKKTLQKIPREILEPLSSFEVSLKAIYNETLIKFDSLLKRVKKAQILLDNSKNAYINSEHLAHIIQKNIAQGKKDQKDLLIKRQAQSKIYEQLYSFETKRFNKEMEILNKEYLEINKVIVEHEESRILFIKSSMEKYRNIASEIHKLIGDFITQINALVTQDIIQKDIIENKAFHSKTFINPTTRFPSDYVQVSYEEYYSKHKEELDKTDEKLLVLGAQPQDPPNSVTLTEEEQISYIKNIINMLLSENEIDFCELSKIVEFINNKNKYPTFTKKLLNCLLEQKKEVTVVFKNLPNLRHLSIILSYITLNQASTITSPNFDLNFKIIYLAERLYYQNMKDNSKTYLSALLSCNKFYRGKLFWKDIIEFRLSNKLTDHIKRLKQTKLREETRTSIFSKLGNALGMTTETRSKSILYNSRIKSFIPNYDEVELSKIELLDQISTSEMSDIIRESIPNLANFNLPSEEALDMIADIAQCYRIPSNNINFYVTYFTVSTNTIRKALPNEMNNSMIRAKYKSTNQKNFHKLISFSLKYLSNTDYLNLLVLNKNSYEKFHKKIYKFVLKNPNLKPKIRLNIWENLLKVKHLRTKFNYHELLKSTENDKKLDHEVKIDVQRTYIGERENPEEFMTKIENVLKVVAVSNNGIRYCQGMNYIAEFLLELTGNEESAYYLFIGFFEYTEYPLIFAQDLERLKLFFYVFKRLISLFEPELFSFFNSNSVDVKCFMPPWFITLFLSARQYNKQKEPPIVLLRILDNFLTSGWKSLLKVSINALHYFETDLLKLKFEEVMQFLVTTMLKFGFFLETNLEHIEKCFTDNRIDKKLIKNIENEYQQDAKINADKGTD